MSIRLYLCCTRCSTNTQADTCQKHMQPQPPSSSAQVVTETRAEEDTNTGRKPTRRTTRDPWSITGPMQYPLSPEGPTQGPLPTPGTTRPSSPAHIRETQVFLDSGCLGNSYIREDIAHKIAKHKPQLFIPCITNVCGAFGQCELSKTKLLVNISMICKSINKVLLPS